MFVVDVYKKFKTYFANLSIYFLASLIPMALSMISNPFIAKNMSPEDYAIVGYYSSFVTLFTPLINFYFIHYFTKRFYELSENNREALKATIFKSFISLSFAMTLVSVAILFIYSVIINKNSEIPFLPYALLSLFRMPLSCIYSLELVDLRMKRNSKSFFKLSVTNSIIAITILLLFVVVLKWGAFGNLSSTLLVHAGMFAYIIYRNRNLLGYKIEWQVVKEAVKFCWPMVIASMLTFFSSGYDKVFLERTGDLVTLGFYSVGVSIASYVSVFSESINSTFQPDIFENIVKRNFGKTIKIIALKLSILSIIIVCFILLAPYIVDILTFGRYVNSTKYAIVASLASLTSMMYYSLSQITVALGYSSITLINKIVGSVLSIITFNLLIAHFGAMGAAWGMVISYLYFFIGNLIMVTIKYKRTIQ